MSEKDILITGATGFIGSHLARALIKHKYRVHAVIRKSSKLTRLADIKDKLFFHVSDITDHKSLKKTVAAIKPTYIFHLANIGVYGGVEGDNERVVKTNLLGFSHLLDATNAIPYKLLVNTGSSSEYGQKTQAMREENNCYPESMYAITKLSATLLAKAHASLQKKPIVTLRLFSPYGPFDEQTRLIPYAIKQLLAGKQLLLSQKNSVRDFIFIDDVIHAYLSCIATNTSLEGEIINIGSGKQITTQQVIKTLRILTNSKSTITWNKAKPRNYESPKWQADITKAKKLLEWKPENTLKEGLKKTINWYKQNLPE